MTTTEVATIILIAGALIGTAYFQIASGDDRPSKPLVTVMLIDEPMILKGHTDAAFDVAYSPDGKRIISTGIDKTIRVWDAESGKELHRLMGHTMPVLCVAFESDGKHFVTAASEDWSRPNFARTAGEVKRWNL